MGGTCSKDYNRGLEKRRRQKLARLEAESRQLHGVSPPSPERAAHHNSSTSALPPLHPAAVAAPHGVPARHRSVSPRLDFRASSPMRRDSNLGSNHSRSSSANGYPSRGFAHHHQQHQHHYGQPPPPHAANVRSRSASRRGGGNGNNGGGDHGSDVTLSPQMVQMINILLSDEIQDRTDLLHQQQLAWRRIVALSSEKLMDEPLRRAVAGLVDLERISRNSIIAGEVKHRDMIVSFFRDDFIEAKLTDMVSAHSDRSFTIHGNNGTVAPSADGWYAAAAAGWRDTSPGSRRTVRDSGGGYEATGFSGRVWETPKRTAPQPPPTAAAAAATVAAPLPPFGNISPADRRGAATGGSAGPTTGKSYTSILPMLERPQRSQSQLTAQQHQQQLSSRGAWPPSSANAGARAFDMSKLSDAQRKLVMDRIRHLEAQELAARNNIKYEEAMRFNANITHGNARGSTVFAAEDALNAKIARQQLLIGESRRMYATTTTTSTSSGGSSSALFPSRTPPTTPPPTYFTGGGVGADSLLLGSGERVTADETNLSLRDASMLALQQRLQALSQMR